MSRFPIAFPCLALNAGGNADPARYALAGIVSLAESILRGVDPSAGPVAIVERETESKDMLSLFDAMLPPATTDKGKEAHITIQVPDDKDGSKAHKVTVQSVRDAIAGLAGESRPYAVVNGTRRTLATVLIWAAGLVVPVLPTVTVEGTDAELRDLSARGNSINDYAKAMSYQTRIAYAISLYDDGCTTEAQVMKRANVGRGIAQLMHSAAVAIRKHGIAAVEGAYPKLDKEGWRKVRDVNAGEADAVKSALNDSTKADTRALTLKRLLEVAERAPAGVAGDVLRAIKDDDAAALGRLLSIPV